MPPGAWALPAEDLCCSSAAGKTKGLRKALLAALAITPCFSVNQLPNVHQPIFQGQSARIHVHNPTACMPLVLLPLQESGGSQGLAHGPGKLLPRLHKPPPHCALLAFGLKFSTPFGQTTGHGTTGDLFQRNRNSSEICYFSSSLFLK